MICSVFRQSRRVNGKSVKRRLYWGQFRLDGQVKITRMPLNTADKQVAEIRLRKIVAEAQQVAEGIIPSPILRHAAQTPLTEHLDIYIATMEKRGNDDQYVYDTGRQIRTLFRECGWKTPVDITAMSFEAWRNTRSQAPKTLNDYLAAMKTFVAWMCKRGLMVADSLSPVGKMDTSRAPKRRERRALRNDEMCRLVAVSEWRAPMYLTAVQTGLRRGELEEILWGDVYLDVPIPYLHVRACISKNGEETLIPLHSDVVRSLLAIRPQEVDPSMPVFRRMYRLKLFKQDLKAAGIPYRDERGRYADFHSFRYTINTNLGQSSVVERVRMQVMRHSDSKLTNKTYMDISQLPTLEAIRQLPSYLPQEVAGSQLRSQTSGPVVHNESQVGGRPESMNTGNVNDTKAKMHVEAQEDTGCENMEMVGTTGFEPVTSCV